MPNRPRKPEADEFAAALREAIARSGLSLDQVRRGLERQGVKLSVATLSYWQSGRSTPERASSIAAIGPLEEFLKIPRGQLAAHLPARTASRTGRVARGSWPRTYADEALQRLGLSYEDFTWLSVHDLVRVSNARTEIDREVRVLLSASRDGVDRYPVWVASDDPDELPAISAMTNCRLGRVQEFRAHTGVAAEMVLPRTMMAGETIIVEHRLTFANSSKPRNSVGRSTSRPFRELSLQVHFEPDAVPATCRRVSTVDGVRTESPLPAHPTAQALFIDGRPGLYELAWDW